MFRTLSRGIVALCGLLFGGFALSVAAAPLAQITPTPTPSAVTFGYTYQQPGWQSLRAGHG